ncbi:phage portal protein (plasmid) [Clostridium perfringens]|uniref:phage portal protein n=1 Tax=Clostridium perfringens TaxID=1502 RepID=UPI001CCA7392|nr:phage portal protein [Clostridium perfringens]UBK83414.1 phage portal protein [Clostridium perfringens]
MEDKLFTIGGYFPPTKHYKRIRKYKDNKKIFEGHQDLVFKDNMIKGDRAKELLYISVNLASIICKKSADFLFGETVQILAGKGEESPEQDAFNKFVEQNHLNILLYENAITNSYCGDTFIKVRYGQEFAGELPPEIDKPRIIIENICPEYVYPETVAWDKNKIKVFHVAIPYYDEDINQWFLAVESHTAGRIDYCKYKVTPIMWNTQQEPERFCLDGIVEGSSYSVNTGVNVPLVVHIPNMAEVGQWQGIDDLTELHPLLDEINNRLSQIADILDKHSNPAMAVPSGLLEEDENGNAQFRVARDKVFEVMGKDDVIPQYITWNGQLVEAFKELDKLIDLVLTIAEIPAVALGKGDSGTSGASGLAIKWRMNSLLAKINRKKQYYTKGLKQVFYIAQKLEEALGIANYNITIPVLHFQDGLPKDEMEQANIMSIRTGGEKTISQKSAIMQLNNFTEEQAEEEIRRIKAEEEQGQEITDLNYFNK